MKIPLLPGRLLRAARLPPVLVEQVAATMRRGLRDVLPRPGAPDMLARLDPLVRPKSPTLDVPPGASFLAGTYEDAAGTRPYRLFVPPHPAPWPALLVMLHGCTQTAEDFAAGTRMNTLAQQAGAYVLYPVQVAQANAQRCWNWFLPADQAAGAGEPAIIAGLTRHVIAEHGIDPSRVFVAGLSAGGAQAAIMASAYPSLFAAVGVHSGLACGAASNLASALAAMRQGHAGQGRITVPAIIFHGDRDRTVNIANAAELAAQVSPAGESRTEQGQAPGGLAWTRMVQPAQGAPRLEQWVVHGLGHAWSGGSPAGSYTEPRGPDASAAMLRFFLQAADQQ